MMIRVLLSTILLTMIAACNQKNPAQSRLHMQNISLEIKTKRIVISEDEYLTVMDIPDNFLGKRCWVYVNDKIKTSHMKCDDDFLRHDTTEK